MADNRQSERRRAERVQSLNLVTCREVAQGEGAGAELMGRTLDVSSRGAMVELAASTPGEFPGGQELLLTLAVNDELVNVAARVAHSETREGRVRRLGVEFLWASPEGKRVFAGIAGQA